MKILNLEEKKILDSVDLFFTKEEALQLISYLNDLVKNPSHQHSHLESDDYSNEITVWLYDKENFDDLPSKVKKMLEDNIWE
ncbi:MAG: hypothetical protein WCT85_06035 [Parachlamydiales bacterium]|jgi:hypothetical protein